MKKSLQRIIAQTPTEQMTLQQARDRGLRYFYSRRLCLKDHETFAGSGSLRYVSTGSCVICHHDIPAELVCHRNLMQRCYNPNNPAYHRYGGRNVKVALAWHDPKVFMEQIGPRPPGATIERFDVNASYSIQTTLWSTRKRQNYNKRNIAWVMLDGGQIPLNWAARQLGISASMIRRRAIKDQVSYQEVIDEYRANPVKRNRGALKYKIEYDGKTLSLKDVAEILGVTTRAITALADTRFNGDRLQASIWYLTGNVKRKHPCKPRAKLNTRHLEAA